MLQRVMIDGIKLPRLYIAENQEDVKLAQQNGIPYIRWKQGRDALIKMLLRPTLERMFPHIKWSLVLGRKQKFQTNVEVYDGDNDVNIINGGKMDDMESWRLEDDVYQEDASVSGSSDRVFRSLGKLDIGSVHNMDIADYVGDMSSYVNIEVLQRLKLMPAFIGDILDCIKTNVGSGMYWSEGYNKKLGLPIGRYDSARQLKNLIILDVSGSIPRGISATMLTLIDTMRSQLSADLIITSTISRFYSMDDDLPTPQELRDRFGYGNESFDFFEILNNHIRNHHYGHVISFGDLDTPDYFYGTKYGDYNLEGTTVQHVHHYHTGLYTGRTGGDLTTGYAKWCMDLPNKPKVSYDTSWTEVIKKKG